MMSKLSKIQWIEKQDAIISLLCKKKLNVNINVVINIHVYK